MRAAGAPRSATQSTEGAADAPPRSRIDGDGLPRPPPRSSSRDADARSIRGIPETQGRAKQKGTAPARKPKSEAETSAPKRTRRRRPLEFTRTGSD